MLSEMLEMRFKTTRKGADWLNKILKAAITLDVLLKLDPKPADMRPRTLLMAGLLRKLVDDGLRGVLGSREHTRETTQGAGAGGSNVV